MIMMNSEKDDQIKFLYSEIESLKNMLTEALQKYNSVKFERDILEEKVYRLEGCKENRW